MRTWTILILIFSCALVIGYRAAVYIYWLAFDYPPPCFARIEDALWIPDVLLLIAMAWAGDATLRSKSYSVQLLALSSGYLFCTAVFPITYVVQSNALDWPIVGYILRVPPALGIGLLAFWPQKESIGAGE